MKYSALRNKTIFIPDMKTITLLLGIFAFGFSTFTFASEESKTWEASDKAKKFVEETIVFGFFIHSLYY